MADDRETEGVSKKKGGTSGGEKNTILFALDGENVVFIMTCEFAEHWGEEGRFFFKGALRKICPAL